MDMSRLKVILVDDNVDEIYLTQRLVTRQCSVDDFISERDPINVIDMLQELAKSEDELSKTVILLDINMPRQNGFDTLKLIRARPEFSRLPVFMYSSSKAPADISKAEELGSDGYLNKPIDPGAFFQACVSNPELAKLIVH